MNSLPQIYVGVDVSKLTLDVHLHPLKVSFIVKNSQAGFQEMHERLISSDIKSITCEATSGYESLFIIFFATVSTKCIALILEGLRTLYSMKESMPKRIRLMPKQLLFTRQIK